MSDKSFGDHINRNIVKNQLLSSAVTGLSLEELTHKAVLLPAPSQEQTEQLDKQQESHALTLAHPDHDRQSFPSGDAFTNLPPSHQQTNTQASTRANLDYQNNEKNRNLYPTTLSKASSKSEDEFDVNEYIARLQGTRYVSAPLHSHINEQNANLETEEALEEINLNERTESSPAEVQQSLTADIAQNFSQLPTVLPHVASAVFSSFSNMLNMRSREVTPEAPQQLQFERNLEVPLVGAEDSAPKDFGLPPKEPPVTGISSYRISSKKKYAPIPGLTYGGAPNTATISAPSMTHQNIPPLYNPEAPIGVVNDAMATPDLINQNVPKTTDGRAQIHALDYPEANLGKDIKTIDNTAQSVYPVGFTETNVPFGMGLDATDNRAQSVNEVIDADINRTEVPRDVNNPYNVAGTVPFNVASGVTNSPLAANQQIDNDFKDITTPRLPIIPPPPMFSNHKSRQESQGGKSFLPPSVARRISANQPLIKPSVPTPSFTDNIFVPTLPVAENTEQLQPSTHATELKSNPVPFFTPPASIFAPEHAQFTPNTGVSQGVSSIIAPPDLFPPGVTGSKTLASPSSTMFTPMEPTTTTPKPSQTNLPPPDLFLSASIGTAQSLGSNSFSSDNASNVSAIPASYPPMLDPNGLTNASPAAMFTPQPTLFTPETTTLIPTVPAASESVPLIEPPVSSGPVNPASMFTPQASAFFNPQAQEPIKPPELKPLVEPPKAIGVNFRLTKKRPQYYSGPIEGVGDISNNVKPVITPVLPPVPSADANFQGHLFTPEPKQMESFAAERTVQNADVPFDINKHTVAQNIETVPFDISKQNTQKVEYATQNVGATAFDINVTPGDYAQQYATYGSQQIYGQYNTAFDFSRSTTDAYEPPKQESKGFGIIGSLKSKLSSIDINKIQSTVTTFFDPAYNEGKIETVKETAPYAQQQYGQFSQSNLEVTVPAVNNQYQYGYQGYNYDQSQYFQAQNAYSYAHNQVHSAYAPQSYTQQLYGTTDHYSSNYNQENIPQNVDLRYQDIRDPSEMAFNNPGTGKPTQIETKFANQELATGKPYVNPNVGTHGAIGDVAKPINPIGDKSFKHVIETKASSFFDNSLGLSESVFKPQYDNKIETEKYIVQSKERFSPPIPPAMSFFDSPKVLDSKKKTEELVEDMQNLAMAEAIALASLPIEVIDPSTCDESKVIDQKQDTPDIKSFTTHKVEEVSHDQGSLIETLTKDAAALKVSNASLYGLSVFKADDTHEISHENKDTPKIAMFREHESNLYPDDQPTFSFFKDAAEKRSEEPPKACLSISDVKNVLLIEPPQENIGAILKRNASSSLLKDLSKSCDKEDENLSQERDSTWNQDAVMETTKDNVHLSYDKNTSEFFDHFSKGNDHNHGKSAEPALDLNICGTCREVNTPEDKDSENVTKQLIENVISSIQLSNPVEAAFTERKSFTIEEKTFVNETIEDINRIAEDTFDTLQAQQASEHSDSSKPDINNYGWTTERLASSTDQGSINSNLDDSDCGDLALNTDKYNTAFNPNYTFKIDSNTIGFGADNSLFFDNVPNNASDELKAEFKTHEDVLPRQMSVPTAPPEEDTKSDGTGGLDVLSIEQDASKDFPLEEEFIIEPSETDDDKIEIRELKRSSEDSVNETFADRIEKFKNKTGVDYGLFDSDLTSAQPKPMTSYLDTENYAADSHYLLNSMPDINAIQNTTDVDSFETSEEAFRLPPGFENEIRRQLNELHNPDNKVPFIPDTSTQTKTTTTATYITTQLSTPGAFKDLGTEVTYSSQTANYFNKTSLIADREAIKQPINTKQSVVSPDIRESVYGSSSEMLAKAFGAGEVTELATGDVKPAKDDATNKQDDENTKKLADPMSFFTNVEEAKPVQEESFNRLASYFSMPPAQPDHSKSFFELSQSQNHYRHVTNIQTDIPKFDDQTQTNIQNLMHDLTSTDNITFGDDIVKTVNYFSLEFDTEPVFPKPENVNSLTKLNQPCLKENGQSSRAKPINIDNLVNEQVKHDKYLDGPINDENTDDELPNETDLRVNDNKIDIIKSCEYCCNIKLDEADGKVKKAADTETEKAEKQNLNMNEKESVDRGKPIALDIASYRDEKEAQEEVTAINESRSTTEYTPVRHHWFYRVDVDDKSVWRGFSTTDSDALELAYRSPELSEETLIPTDGGRFDVNIVGRLRIAVYWKEKPTNVRRCSWFYKGTTDARYVPYTEAVADKLEEEFRHGVTTGEWHRRLVLPNNELVVMHGPAVMVHFLHAGAPDSFSSPPFLLGKKVYRNPPKIRVARDLRPNVDHLILVVHGAGEYKRNSFEDSTSRPRVVRRGHEESEIEDPEPSSIDHLLLLCHGVGSACDMRFRSVEEVVEDFRTTSLQLLQSHYRNSYDNGIVNRVEVLPISWHAQLHVGEKGVDNRLNKVTLESIPRLRAFTNHTVLDALFYTSPVYHQTIIDTVCYELNRIYNLFKQRNPSFKGGVSLGGHSLGSVILYDLLCHQNPEKPLTPMSTCQKSYLGHAQPAQHTYPQLEFPPDALYALGSPIAIFECIRGVEALGMDFALPTCKNFFNIFHPYDPIAYRIEPLINPLLQDAKPFLIPHHKGRKRMHLELKDTVVRVGADLKQKLLESLRTTWNKWKSSPPPDGQLEKVVEEEIEKEQLCDESKEDQTNADSTTPEMLGKLNSGRRVDYVLQEAPLEMINEYLFAMSSHVGYWESEDTMLLMLREIYNALGVPPDCTVPQQSMTVTRTKQDETIIVNEKEFPSTSKEFS